MNMRPLVIDQEAKKKVQRILDYALDPKHWYQPGKTRIIPGHDAHFVTRLDTYRCVFTITLQPGGFTHRHLTISVPSENYPNPYAAYSIAQLFGFTGWDEKTVDPPEGWMIRVNEDEHCIALGQAFEAAEAQA